MTRQYSRSPIPTIFTPKMSDDINGSGDRYIVVGKLLIPLRLRTLIIFPILYLMFGIHLPDLWRGVDANTYSVLLGLQGDVFFQGEIFRQSVATAPAYYRLLDFGTRLSAGLFSPLYGMRLTHVMLILMGLIALYRALRSSFSPDIATPTVLITATCLGGLEFMHLVGQKAGVFFALCITLWGITLSFRRPAGGAIAGLGFALSVMMGSGTVLPTLLPALILLFYWRQQNPAYRIAMTLALSMMGITLFSFYIFTGRSAIEASLWLPPRQFREWNELFFALLRQCWFTFPLWAAFLGFQHYTRKQWSADSKKLIYIGILGTLVALPFSITNADGPLMLLPMLSLLFAPSLLLLSNAWLRAWHWFNFLFFTMTLLPLVILRGLWAYGFPESLVRWLTERAPDFDPHLHPLTLMGALLLVFSWGYWMLAHRHSLAWRFRPIIGWVIGHSVMWMVFVLLWLPPINHGKSYSAMFKKMVSDWQTYQLPEKSKSSQCVDIRQAPLVLQILWRNMERVENYDSCSFRIMTIGKTERQSLLLSDQAIRKEEDEHAMESAPLTMEGDLSSSAPTLNPADRWLSLSVYQRFGENQEHIVLQWRNRPSKNY